MKQTIACGLLLLLITALNPVAGAQTLGIGPDQDSIFGSTAIDAATDDDSWEGETGLNWHSAYPDEGDDGHAGWGFLDVEWESASVYGFQFGVGALAVVEAWDEDGLENVVDETGAFADAAKWTQAYVKYTIPDTETHILIGRAEDGTFGEPNGGDGDYYQGVGVVVKDIPRLTLTAHAVNKWLNNASAHWNLDGIDDDWRSMDDVIREVGGGADDAGDFAYTLMAEIGIVPDRLTLTPSIQYHEDVATSLGVALEGDMEITDAVSVGGESVYLHHFEDTPGDVNADDDDLSQFMIQVFGKFKELKAGVGYYAISDDVPIFNTLSEGGDDFEDVYVMDEIDPMEEDLAKYGEQPNSETWFFFAEYGYGPFDLNLLYGWADDAVVEDGFTYRGEARELNLILNVGVTRNLSAELAYIDVRDDYEADGDRSMDIVAGSIAYTF